ncbi:GyrI-like domain-containing protein, partial [Vibrio antiquarius]
QLKQIVDDKGLSVNGELFCYYQSMDMQTGTFEFITCLPLDNAVTAPEGAVFGTIPESETFVVEHRGEYQFLGNAWALAMNLVRQSGMKAKTSPLGIERYLDNLQETTQDRLRTEVILFKK